MEMARRELETLKAASLELGASYSQAKRICRRYPEGGAGEPSNNKAVELHRERYYDFVPTLAQKTLFERDSLEISVNLTAGVSVRRVMEAEKEPRRMPEPADAPGSFGEPVRFDGGRHGWFEGWGDPCRLMATIGDAAKARLSGFFGGETMFGAMAVLKMWMRRCGTPKSLYRDKKNAFALDREPTDAEVLAGVLKPKSHFGGACDQLGIEVTAANSPQAKGRVERSRGVGWGRLANAPRLEGVGAIEKASRFSRETCPPKMNGKFSRPAGSGDEARVNPGKATLDNILRMEFDRRVSKASIIRFQARLFQILKTNRPPPRTKDEVPVRIRLENFIHVIWKDKPLLVKEIPAMFDE
jgi:hypothetical protein